ncbi:hypothetical protein CSV69_14570 [Sporosarcina sp. P26b]|uniref:Ig-like domain-containing protein n=1 Tax=Sporosarcina sp. P26b TaxID=2048253 RepID=UPI000C16A41E|nr:Ig-like domain-containing protein [Sporosarcina sp. P26b]PIC94855.1 hypothetical protein CSV69_14570 [Sporosarcina sp. P26b]
MKKRMNIFMKSFFIAVLTFLLVMSPMFNTLTAEAVTEKWKALTPVTGVTLDKEWTITFNQVPELSAITPENIYVKDANNNIVDTVPSLIDKSKKVKLPAPLAGYRANETYTLYVDEAIYSAKEQMLKESVKLDFTTGSSPSLRPEFIPRADSPNTVIFENGVKELRFETADDVISIDTNVIVFGGTPTEIIGLKKGDIFILPPSEEYPTGLAKKVVEIKVGIDSVSVFTEEPLFEEVIGDIDISNEFKIEAQDIIVDREVFDYTDVDVSNNGKRITYSKKDEPEEKLTVDFNNGNPIITFGNIEMYPRGKNEKPVTLSGTTKLTRPSLKFDSTNKMINHAEFIGGLDSELKLSAPMSLGFKKEGDDKSSSKKPLKMPIKIPIKAYGVVGATIELSLLFNASGKIETNFALNSSTLYNMGITKVNGKREFFNHSRESFSSSFNLLEGQMNASLTLLLEVHPEVVRFKLATLGAEGGYSATISGNINVRGNGQINWQDSCYKLDHGFFARAYGQGRLNDWVYFEVTQDLYKYPLVGLHNCSYYALDYATSTILLQPGQKKSLELSGVKGDFVDRLKLPNDNIQLAIADSSIATTNVLGQIIANPKAKHGDRTILTIRHQSESSKPIEIRVPIVIEFLGAVAEKKDLEKARYTTTLSDDTGLRYKVFVIPVKEKQYIQQDSWAGGTKGDQMYEGDYRFALQPVSTGIARWQEPKQEEYIYNKTMDKIYKVSSAKKEGQDILALSENSSSNTSIAGLYTIKGNRLIKLSVEQDDLVYDGIAYSGKLKYIGKELLQYEQYDNQEYVGWTYRTLQLVAAQEKLVRRDQVSFVDEKMNSGARISEQWHSDPDYSTSSQKYSTKNGELYKSNALGASFIIPNQLRDKIIIEEGKEKKLTIYYKDETIMKDKVLITTIENIPSSEAYKYENHVYYQMIFDDYKTAYYMRIAKDMPYDNMDDAKEYLKYYQTMRDSIFHTFNK